MKSSISNDVIDSMKDGNINQRRKVGRFKDMVIMNHTFKINYSLMALESEYVEQYYTQFNITRAMPKVIIKILMIKDENDEFYEIKIQAIAEFIKYHYGEDININDKNFCFLEILSYYFRTWNLNQILEQYEKENLVSNLNPSYLIRSYLSHIWNQFSHQNKGDIDQNNFQDSQFVIYRELLLNIENKIINHLELCIQNELFKQLPIEVIYRIFEKKGRKNIPQDALFSFIEFKNEKHHIFFPFICIESLSEKNQKELLDCLESSGEDALFPSYFQFPLCYIHGLHQKIIQLTRINTNLKDKNSKLELQIMDLTNLNNQLKNSFDSCTIHNHEMVGVIKELKKENKRIKDDNMKLNTEKNELEKENKRIKDDNMKLNTEKNELGKENKRIKDDNMKLNTEKNELGKENKRIKDDNMKLNTEKNELGKENKRIKDDNMKLNTEKNELGKENKRIKDDNMKLNTEKNELGKENKRIKDDNMKLNTEKNELEKETPKTKEKHIKRIPHIKRQKSTNHSAEIQDDHFESTLSKMWKNPSLE